MRVSVGTFGRVAPRTRSRQRDFVPYPRRFCGFAAMVRESYLLNMGQAIILRTLGLGSLSVLRDLALGAASVLSSVRFSETSIAAGLAVGDCSVVETL